LREDTRHLLPGQNLTDHPRFLVKKWKRERTGYFLRALALWKKHPRPLADPLLADRSEVLRSQVALRLQSHRV
jgi:hypothetical protein